MRPGWAAYLYSKLIRPFRGTLYREISVEAGLPRKGRIALIFYPSKRRRVRET